MMATVTSIITAQDQLKKAHGEDTYNHVLTLTLNRARKVAAELNVPVARVLTALANDTKTDAAVRAYCIAALGA